MGLKYNINAINNKLIPAMNSINSPLQSAIDEEYSISKPSNFSYNYYLNNLPGEIRKIKSQVSSVSSYIGKSVRELQSMESKNAGLFSGIGANLNINLTGGTISATASISISNPKAIATAERVVSIIGSLITGKWITNGVDLARKTAATVLNKADAAWSKIVNTTNKIESKITNFFKDKIISPIQNTKALITTKCSNIWNDVKTAVSKAWDSTKDAVSKAWNSTKDTVSKAWDSTKEATSKAWTSTKNAVSKAWDATENAMATAAVWTLTTIPKAWEHIQKTAASISNGVIALAEGLMNVVEYITDFCMLVITAAGSIASGLVDGVSALYHYVNGDMENYHSQTVALWKETMAVVEDTPVKDTFNWFYQDTAVGQWLDEKAYSPFKSDGVITSVTEGIGEVIGITLLTIATAGTATPVTLAATAGMTAFGKYTNEYYSEQRAKSWEGMQEELTNMYNDMVKKGEITEEESKAALESIFLIRTLNDEGWEVYENAHSSGQLDDETYNYYKMIREMPEDWKTFETWANAMGYAGVNAALEAGEWYLGGQMNEFAKFTSEIGNAAVRVGVDTLSNAVDPFIRTGAEVVFSDNDFSNGKNDRIGIDEAWQEQGGWQGFFSNLAIGFVGSAGGEALDGLKDICKRKKTTKIKNLGNNVDTANNINSLEKFNMDHPDSIENGVRKLQDSQQVAEYFADPKGFIADYAAKEKFGNMSDLQLIEFAEQGGLENGALNKFNKFVENNDLAGAREYVEGLYGGATVWNMDDKAVYEYAKQHLAKDEFSEFEKIFENRRRFSQVESDTIMVFAKTGGPAIEAYLRSTDVTFEGHVFNGANYQDMNSYFRDSVSYCGKLSTLGNMNIEDSVRILDNIVENSEPLKESLTVTRYVDSIFKDGTKIADLSGADIILPDVGTTFGDKGFLSTSAAGGVFSDRKIRLEIEVPEGTKAAYIQSESVGILGSYKQQELLLGRNNNYQIVDYVMDQKTGQLVVKAKMMDSGSSLRNILDCDKIDNRRSYFDNYYMDRGTGQVELSQVVNEMQEKGILAQCEAEAREAKMSGIYDSSIAGHGMEHIEDVILNAAYIAEKEGFDVTEKKLLMDAAKYHDAGKGTEGITHGIEGAKNAKKYLNNMSADDMAIVQSAIEYHSIKDDKKVLEDIFDKYNVAAEDREMAERIANALKDADALDRSRFPGNLDAKYLRTDTAKSYVVAAHQMQDIKAKNYLDKYLTGNVTASDKAIIENLRNSNVSDYEIAFWLQYAPEKIGGVMGAWQSVDYKINNVLGGYNAR